MAAASGVTGDIRNNLMKLLREVQRMKLRLQPDVQGLGLGAPSALLPVLHHSLMHYSLPLASWLARHDYDLYCKNDLRFVEGVYKVLREVFGHHPRLTKEQFLTVGYAERKLQLVTELLRACQRKHISLVGGPPRRGGRGGRGRNRRRTSESLGTQPNSRSEVLTVQTTSGIGSAWSEPLVAQVQAGQDSGGMMSSLHDYSPPPHRLTPSQMLELTPSPPPPRSQHSPQSQPLIIRHETPPTNTTDAKLVPRDENLEPSSHLPLGKLLIDSLSSSSDGGSEGEGGGEEGHAAEGDERETVNKSEDDRQLPPSQQTVVLNEVSRRVEQLTGLMERMSARFVLLETQLKTIRSPCEPQRENHSTEGPSEGQLKKQVEPQSLGREEDVERCGLGENRGQKQDLMQEEEARKEDVPLVNTVAKGTTVSMVAETPSSKARAALADLSNPRLNQRETHKSYLHTSTPLTRHTLTPVARRQRGRGGALSSQLARIRAEKQLSPLPSSHPHIPSSSHPHTPSPNVLSTSPSLPSPTSTSPDETTRMIACLRARAQRTKEFLQKANHRL